METAAEGKYVQIYYTGTFDNGDVFDTTAGKTPLEFQVGTGKMMPGLDNAVVGMKIDEEKDIVLQPDEAYGQYDESRKQAVPKTNFPEDLTPEIGMPIAVQTANGQHIPARIVEIGDDDVTLDLNHPLAGKVLHFNLKIIAINDEPQLQQGCDCDCSDDGCSSSSEGCGC